MSNGGYKPLGDGNERHEKVTVDEKTRMHLNGESKEQMAHAYAIKKAGGVSLDPADGTDTSKDSAFEYDTSPSGKHRDLYVMITTVIYFLPKLLIFTIPMMVCCFPACLICQIYCASLPDNTKRVHRSCYFYMVFFIALIVSIPAIVLILVGLVLDYTFYYIFSLPFCFFTCHWKEACRGFELIKPYRNGPSVSLHFADFFVCIIGQCARQTVGETFYMVACMFLIMPWLKYYINCNPYIYNLQHCLKQQISTQMDDLGTPSQVADTSRRIISQCRQSTELAHRIDLWSFVPHYPYPPLNRRWALGLQAGGSCYPGKFTLIVHTTHAICDAKGSTEQFVLSNSVDEPIYRVMLWYSNPFHFLTGFVEASVSNGKPSQLDKYHGGEHPMWLITSNTPLIGGRDSFTGSGLIDGFFDYWLPVFVHEMRRLTWLQRGLDAGQTHAAAGAKALDEANKLYQEVVSVDGVSKPDKRIGLDKYDGKTTIDDFDKEAKHVHKDVGQKVTDKVEGFAYTGLGKSICKLQLGNDLVK